MIHNNHSGYIMLIVISVLSILIIMALAASGISIYGLHRTAQLRDSVQAYYAAQAGINQTLMTIQETGIDSGKLDIDLFSPNNKLDNELILLQVKTQWNPSSDTRFPGSLEITSTGIIKSSREIRFQRTLKALTDPASANKKILFLYDQIIKQPDMNKSLEKPL